MQKWYERDLRRILVDQHIPDWNERFFSKFDPERYADMMVKAHVTCAEIYAGNSLGICLFPTQKGYAHKQLKGRDFFGETAAACRRRGIDVQAYFSYWATMPYKMHPEWRMILYSGKGNQETYGGRWGVCCMNGGFGDYFLAELDELNSRYDVQGFWIDMFGWFGILCQCPDCKRRYYEETGEDLPQVIDWNDPHFTRYAQWRSKSMGEFAQRIRTTIHTRTPDRTVNIQCASLLRGWAGGMNEEFLQASEYLAGDFTGNAIEQSYVSKLFSAFSPHRPMEFMTPRCENLAFHTTERSRENLLMRAYAALANQSSFTLIDAIDPEGTLDERFYDHAREINDAYARYEKYVLGCSVPLADIAIYYSFSSRVNIDCGRLPIDKCNDAAFAYNPNGENLVRALADAHLTFTFTDVRTLKERALGTTEHSTPGDICRYPVVFVAFGARLTDEECAALETYVANGGKLYTSYCTSLYNPEKGRRDDFALAKLFGVHYRGLTQKRTYIAPTKESLLLGIATEQYPLMLDSRQCMLEADGDTIVEGTLTLPISETREPEYFSSGISDPPMLPQGTPALVRHKYGKGEVIYCAGVLEEVKWDYHRKALITLLKELRGQQYVETDAPRTTEITVYEQPDEKRLVISLLNLPSDLPAQPLHDIHVKLNLPERFHPTELLLAPDETPYPCSMDGHAVEFTVPVLNEFAMFLLKTE
ncbi:MAG: beta-galactosidase trimerization domain-containing protein [Victivallales bacterium]|nr:beta-galactosidase trimerization domain-containing protein [Victivallales bacterium]